VPRSELTAHGSAGCWADFDVARLEVSVSADEEIIAGCFSSGGRCQLRGSRRLRFSLAGWRIRPGGCSSTRTPPTCSMYRTAIALWALLGVLALIMARGSGVVREAAVALGG